MPANKIEHQLVNSTRPLPCVRVKHQPAIARCKLAWYSVHENSQGNTTPQIELHAELHTPTIVQQQTRQIPLARALADPADEQVVANDDRVVRNAETEHSQGERVGADFVQQRRVALRHHVENVAAVDVRIRQRSANAKK